MNVIKKVKNHYLPEYYRLMRFDKPIGILLLLWPTLWGLWLAAKGIPPLTILLVFVFGVIVMRAAGCVINDIADRHFDRQVTRTQNRPLATGALPLSHSIILFITLCVLALCLVIFLNWLTLLLAIPGVVIASVYPFMKRYTHWPQAFLGIAFSWGIPMAFSAIQNKITPLAWWLLATNFLWVIAYDTMYAMVDRSDDIKAGIKSTAVLFGKYDRFIIFCLQVMVLISLLIIAVWNHFNALFFIAWLVAIALALYQQILIRNQQPEKCFSAFLNNHWFGLAIFIGIALGLI
ncbi:MAG: 4-hydroxybenzoate octaprenyltransferase [Proteobacteria bacterium]|nr:4-hydroxybenzoate octaprenyltransferase [Pseudomonadota bacterium]